MKTVFFPLFFLLWCPRSSVVLSPTLYSVPALFLRLVTPCSTRSLTLGPGRRPFSLSAAIIDSLGARTIIHNVFTFSLMTLVLLFFSPLLKVR